MTASNTPAYITEDDLIGLRPMVYEDCERYVAWRNDPRIQRYYIYRRTFTLAGEQQFFREKIATGEVLVYVICLKKNGGEPVGCAILNAPEEDGSREYGLFIGERTERGIGIGRRVTDLVTSYALTVLGIPKVTARVFSDNLRSMQSAQAGGLRVTGVLRDVVCTDG
ncbi:MAG: GNAT family N-acetyltransferase, partial [Lachnospiraceae bacterium]